MSPIPSAPDDPNEVFGTNLVVAEEASAAQPDDTSIVEAPLLAVGIVGGAPDASSVLARACPYVGDWVAADGGADLLLDTGITPQLVVGDFDSISDSARAAFAMRLHLVTEQETTDFDKALRMTKAEILLAIGFTGGRFDHELAVMNALVRHAHRRCIVLGEETLAFHCPPKLRLHLGAEDLVSLFPLASVKVRSAGLQWPTDGLELSPAGVIGTSNKAAHGEVCLCPDAPGLLVILRADALGPAFSALAQTQTWPRAEDAPA